MPGQFTPFWSGVDGTPIGQPMTHGSGVRDLALCSESKLVCTVDGQTARFWSALDGAAVGLPIVGPTERQNAFSFVRAVEGGRTIVVWGSGRVYRLQVPTPLKGKPNEIGLWAEIVTGREMDEHGTVRVLTVPTWKERKRQLEAIGWPRPGRLNSRPRE